MRRYELMLLLRPDLEDDKLQSAVEKVTRAIVNGGGSLSKVSPWGKRRLAYEISHFREASYFLIHFDIEPAQVRDIERGLLISDEILRHLVTVIEDRGPVDEVPPAAAPREAAASDGVDADDGGKAGEAPEADEAAEAAEAGEADTAGDEADDVAATADVDGEARGESAPADDVAETADADGAGSPTDEPAVAGERAEG